MKSEFPKIFITIIVIFCMLTIIAICNRGSPDQIARFAAVPISLVLTWIIMHSEKKIEEYLAMFMVLKAKCSETNKYTNEAISMLQSYIKLKNIMGDLLYVNYSSLDSFKGIRSAMKSSEDVMKNVSRGIYSRIVVADARGSYTAEDYRYINKYFTAGREAITRTSELLNEISDIGGHNLDLSYISSFNESLRKLNNKIKEDFYHEK